jgi:peptidyl-Lys metalloendopeptidase
VIVTKQYILALVLLLCVKGLSIADANTPDGIEVSLRAIEQEFSVDESITIEFAYKNTTASDITMLKWGSAFESRLNADILSVLYQGEELYYSGRHIKRAPAGEDDYVVLMAQSVTLRKVDLLTAYPIDFMGQYEIRLRESAPKAEKAQSALVLKLSSDRPITFKRTPTVTSCPDEATYTVPDGKGGVLTVNLPNNRISLIDSAVSSAESIARTAKDSLENTPIDERANARRYREWFGSYNLSRWDTVQSHFNLIYNAVSGLTLAFICDDTESAFAYVYRSQPYDIYLGQAFWSAPRTGTDSKAGTIIHELSHFNVLGGTDDNVYGQSGARSLAKSNPSNAVSNADSHEYFAENTPFLSMPVAIAVVEPTLENRPSIIGALKLLLFGDD